MAKQTNSIAGWRMLADRDMAVADHLATTMYPTPTEIIAFHCHQAAEKYLKGALVALGEEPPYIHDLDRLRLQAEKHRPSFNAIASFCTVITHFAVQPRYDEGLSISESDMRTVLHHAKAIRDFLQNEIPELFLTI
ncbi:MAG: HEPN domain-containing protein [Treponema sp.]|jgi:HEPN domain-containing protein|nr:HEPN domain-containing protein [Treponema sp.]